MAHEKAIAEGFDALWGKSLERNWILGRLGLPGPVFNVPDKPGYKYVNRGAEGEQGQVIARDRIGVAAVFNQRVRMRREFGEYVIREAEYLDSSGGLSNTLAGLTDVTLTSLANGHIIHYDSGLGEWVNAAPGGGGGGSYFAGDAIDIDGGNVIGVKVNSSSAIVVDSGSNTLRVNVGDGLKIATNALTLNLAASPGLEYSSGQVRVDAGDGIMIDASGVTLNLATDPGLEYGTGGDAHKVRVKEYFGIERSINGIGVRLKTPSGLEVDIGGLAILDSIAGNGLVIASKILAVGAGDGIDSNANDVAVDVTDIIDTAAGLKEDASNNIQVRLETNSGLSFGGAGGVQLGAPATLSVSSANSVTSTTHSHAITSSSDVGTTPAASILASTGGGQLTLAQLTIRGNLVFAGGDRSITASNNLTISPSTDLILDPSGLVLAPNAQDIRTVTINDLPTGIDGFRIWNRYSNYSQLTIGAIKADELYIRVFVADETRIDRGEEYWSKSFGIVQEDFTLPAVNSTVDVWFEDAPAAVTFNLFAVNDYLLCRTIDWGTGLVVQKIWFQVTAAKLAQQTTAINGVDRQQWRIRRLQGGVNGSLIKRGNLALDTGAIGQGWIHLSALSQDGGPFIQIGTMTSVATVPQFTNYVRMGNLNGTVDYATNIYGFAAGNSLGTTPSGGFSGMVAEATNGLRLFNTSLYLYSGSTLQFAIDRTLGIRILQDLAYDPDLGRHIRWYDSLGVGGIRLGEISFYKTGTEQFLNIGNHGTTDRTSQLALSASDDAHVTSAGMVLSGYTSIATGGSGSNIVFNSDSFVYNGPTALLGGKITLGANNVAPVSTAHVYENTATTGAAAGVTIEQNGAGDALLQFFLSGGRRWVVGIDNSDSDKFKISNNAALGAADVLIIDTAGNFGIRASDPDAPLTITTPDSTLANNVNQIRLRSQRTTINSAGLGLIGGIDFMSNDTQLTAPGAVVAMIQAIASATHNATVLDTALRFSTTKGLVMAEAGRFSEDGFLGLGVTTPASPLHIYENTTATTTAIGVTIEQNGTGDAKVQFLLTGGQRWGIGIDNSTTNDYLVIAPGTDLATTPYLAVGTSPYTGEIAIGIGTVTPGINLIGTQDSNAGPLLQIDGVGAGIILRGSSSASLQFIHTGATSGERSMTLASGSGLTRFYIQGDTFGTLFIPIHIDHSNGYVGMNELSPETQLEVGSEATNVIRSSVYGATNWFNYVARRALTSKASPSAVQLNTIMGSWGALGYSSSGWPAVASAQMQFRAAENYTSTGRGSKIEFYTTLDGTTTLTRNFTIENDGGIIAPYIWATALNGTAVQISSNGVLTKATSSIRFKKNVREMPGDFGDDFIMALKPIVYNNKFGDDANDYLGFVAEDVFGIGGKPFISFNDDGLVESLHYDKLTVPLVAAVQDLIPYKARIVQLEAEMAELRARVNAMLEL